MNGYSTQKTPGAVTRFIRLVGSLFKQTAISSPVSGGVAGAWTSYVSGATNSLNHNWMHDYDVETLSGLAASDAVRVLIDADPDFSQAVWSMIRLCNSGYRIQARNDNGTPNSQAQKYIETFLNSLSINSSDQFRKYNSIDALINKLNLYIITRGATGVELVLNDNRDPVDIVTIDPCYVYYEYKGDRPVPYQLVGGEKVWMDYPNIVFVTVDPFGDYDLEGRSPLLSAIQVVFFKIRILNDLRRVLHRVGYPRLEVKINEEVLIKNAPQSISRDPVKLKQYLEAQIAFIQTQYNHIAIDQAIIHLDSIDVGNLELNGGSALAFNVQALIEIIETQIIAALKSLPSILGRVNKGTESVASAEVTIYLKTLEEFQHLVQNLMTNICTQAVRLAGYRGRVLFEFLPIEVRTKTELAQWESVMIQNVKMKLSMGYMSEDEACIMLTGHSLPPDWEKIKEAHAIIPPQATSTNPSENPSNDGQNPAKAERPTSGETTKEANRTAANKDRKRGRQQMMTTIPMEVLSEKTN